MQNACGFKSEAATSGAGRIIEHFCSAGLRLALAFGVELPHGGVVVDQQLSDVKPMGAASAGHCSRCAQSRRGLVGHPVSARAAEASSVVQARELGDGEWPALDLIAPTVSQRWIGRLAADKAYECRREHRRCLARFCLILTQSVSLLRCRVGRNSPARSLSRPTCQG